MPLVRFQVKNQYGLGQPELYSEADGGDPKAVLDGVAVAGLVGILRQLGDLAEFAGEVFHGLQEQVTMTASRSHKLMVRVQNIEAALPPIEKSIQAQSSHLHFAYTPGVEWHPRIGNEQNHFIYNDLPRFIMDSYEECRDPPRLHLLDRFDTGGSGSCMKRYSDPTFFKRVSTSSNDKNIEKTRKDKKTRKIKKKRSSSLRNGEFSRGTSIYSCSGRMQFASSIGNGQASPSQTASTVDKTLKSEAEHSNSFDSRTGSGYIECVFPQDSKKASPRSPQHDDNIDSVFSDSIEEKIAPGSSCVSWEEKEEIVETKGQHYDDDGDEDLLEKSDIDLVKNVDQMDTVSDDRSELDDIESETDNYVDALNTIESESEYDHDCQTKQEVKRDSNVDHKEMEDEIDELHVYNVLNKEVPSNLLGSASSESTVHENEPEVMEISSNSDHHSPRIDAYRSADTHDETKVDSAISKALPSGSSDHDSQDRSGKRVITSFFPGSQESPTINNASTASGSSDSQDRSGKRVITSFFPGSQESPRINNAISPSVSSDHQDRSGKRVISSFPVSQESPTISNATSPSGSSDHQDRSGKRVITSFPVSQESPTNNNASSPSGSSDHQDGSGKRVITSFFPGSQESPTISNASLSSGSSDHDVQDQSGKKVITRFPDSQESPAEISSTKPVKLWTNGGLLGLQPSKPPDFAVSNTKTEVSSSTIKDGGGKDKESDDLLNGKRSCHANLENDEKASLMFGLGHRLLVNGFHRKLTLVPDDDDDDKPMLSNSLERIQETTFRDSPSSSPPLEHMKISFHPVNGFETSKMKLNLESVEDMFPSFQLVPDSAMPPRDTDFDSDSDDGTFCRSSPYVSDDCNSVQSDLNSEEWEAGENIGSKDMELYDAFCRVEGSESVSSSDGNHLSIENGVEHTRSCPLQEPPRLDVMNSVHQQEPKGDSDPLPPPLPPVQWRVLKSQPEMKQEPQDRKEALELVKPSISPQARLDSAVKHESNGAVGFESKNEEWPKMNRQNKAKEASNGKGTVERDDFLQQIRTQSFNLRRITPPKPAPVSAPTSNVSVTAILEKANAIRQAVASYDGEEDTWSDT